MSRSDQGLHCLPESQNCLWTDPLDRFIWNLRGIKFFVFFFILFFVRLQKLLYFGSVNP